MYNVICVNGSLRITCKDCNNQELAYKVYPPFKLDPVQEGAYFLYGSVDKQVYLPDTSYNVEGFGEQSVEQLVELIDSGVLCPEKVVDVSYLAAANLSGDANADNVVITLTSVRADTGLVIAANEIENTIGGDYVKINAMSFVEEPSLANRVAPSMELLKNGVVVAKSATGYQRHNNGHESSSNSICYTDPNPEVADKYTLRSQRGINNSDVMPIDLGSFSLKVVTKV